MDADVPAGLERSAHLETLVLGGTTVLVHGSGPARTSEHVQTGWKVVAAHRGAIGVAIADSIIHGELLAVPPGVRHRMWSTGAYTAMLFDPGALPASGSAVQVIPLDPAGTGPALLTPTATGDPDQLGRRLLSVLAEAAHVTTTEVDERLVEALAGLAEDLPLPMVAARAAVSSSHLRRLAQEQLGVPLVRVRNWSRLRSVVRAAGSLGAAAATAGFADQAHLTRTARLLVGRTPAEIAHAQAAGVVGRACHG